MNATPSKATAKVEQTADTIQLKVGGSWRLTEALPELEDVMPAEVSGRELQVVPAELVEWDSSLPLFLLRVRAWCHDRKTDLNLEPLPAALKKLFQLISASEEQAPPNRTAVAKGHFVARAAQRVIAEWKGSTQFIGECALAGIEVPADPRHFHWKAFLYEMVQAGPRALPIIGLLTFLIGLTFAFETAVQLQRFGAQIYVIDGIGVAVLRQIGPIVAAVLLAGRTGAAFAGRLANMKLGGEIDALEMLGVSPVKFLVLPRVIALVLMMPFIALYSDLMGILGGLMITDAKLHIPSAEFWVRLQTSASLTDLSVGLVKSVVFGVLIGLAGTLRGLQSERSSVGVGRAVTSAVVTGISAIIVADALFSPVLQNLGL